MVIDTNIKEKVTGIYRVAQSAINIPSLMEEVKVLNNQRIAKDLAKTSKSKKRSALIHSMEVELRIRNRLTAIKIEVLNYLVPVIASIKQVEEGLVVSDNRKLPLASKRMSARKKLVKLIDLKDEFQALIDSIDLVIKDIDQASFMLHNITSLYRSITENRHQIV